MPHPPPKRPTLDWPDLAGADAPSLPSFLDLTYKQTTTSGRSAIYHALTLAAPKPGTAVLVPTYHCPTMIAPVALLGLEPLFYSVDGNGLPNLSSISDADARRSACILAPHYFGITQSFARLRAWCDATETLLIEDCAHAFYGMAGERQVGAWGDYATTSLTKFFPVLEGGMLGSSTRPVPQLSLTPQPIKAELKAAFDIAHLATEHCRLKGLGALIRLARISRGRAPHNEPCPSPTPGLATQASTSVASAIRNCDMTRVTLEPLRSTRWLVKQHAQQRACQLRQRHFTHYAEGLSNLPGTHPLHTALPTQTAPYAFPLWVDDAERIYHTLRTAGVPVYRWDRHWPGTPEKLNDHGRLWSKHVLQLLTHQTLTEFEIDLSLEMIYNALQNRPA